MKKHLRLIKTLIVAAGLLTGATSAWADDVYNQLYKRAVTEWTEDDISETEWVGTNTTLTVNATEGNGLCLSGGKTYSLKKTFSISENAKVKYEGVWTYFRATGRNENYNYIQIGDKIRISVPNGGTMYLNTDGTSSSSTTTGVSNTSKSAISCSFSIIVNTATGAVESFLLAGSDITSKIGGNVSGNFDSFTIGHDKQGGSGSSDNRLSSITVSECPQTVTTVDYTVKFQDTEGVSLKDDVVYTKGAIVGDLYIASASDMATFYNDGETKKYIYRSGQNTSVTATSTASENVITLVFDTYEKTAYTVNAQVSGETIKELETGSTFFDGSYKTYYSRYILGDDSKWYVTTAPYNVTISTATTNVTYTLADPQPNYFFEESDFTISSSNGTTTKDFLSKGNGTRLSANSYAYTSEIAGGTYTMIVGGCIYSGSPVMQYGYRYNNENVLLGQTSSFGNGSYEANKTVEGVIIPDGSSLAWLNTTDWTSNLYFDYITLIRTGDASVPVTLSSTGYSSLASAYGLDFSGVEGLTAYVVTNITKDAVTLTSVNELPANSGVILKGEAGAAYSIPVKADAAYAGTNKLYAAVEAYNCDANEVYILKDALFHLVTEASTVPAGKAYLKATDVPKEARSLGFLFGDDETNGINAVSSNQKGSEFYNLQGLRVDAPKKGMYIVNGKKVIIK